jgi:transposase
MARATRSEWAKRVERWQDSGLTAKEFAAELDVSASSLTFWKWKLGRDKATPSETGQKPSKRSSKAAEPKFLQLVTTNNEAVASAAPLELVIRRDIVVRVHRGFDEQTLARVIHALGAR